LIIANILSNHSLDNKIKAIPKTGHSLYFLRKNLLDMQKSSYLCSDLKNVERFGQLATTEKNAKNILFSIPQWVFFPSHSSYIYINKE